MSRDYYLVIDEEREGPFTRRQISERIRAGELENDVIAWYRGSDDWVSLRDLPEFAGMEAEEEEAFDADGSVSSPGSHPQDREGGVASVEGQHAATNPWMRFAARGVDIIVLSAFAGLLLGVIPMPMSAGGILMKRLLQLVLIISGEAFLLSWVGTTPGKSLFGLSVRRESGGLLRYKEALIRTAHLYLLGLGLIIPPFIFIGMAVSYFLLKSKGRLPWDRGGASDVFLGPRTPWKVGLGIFILTSYMLASIMGFLFVYQAVKEGDFEKLPPGTEELLKELGLPVSGTGFEGGAESGATDDGKDSPTPDRENEEGVKVTDLPEDAA